MAGNSGTISGEVTLDAQKAVSALNQLIDKLAVLQASGPQAAKSIDAVEKSAVNIASGLAKGTTSVREQTKAIQELIVQYRALSKEGLKGTGGITQTLNNTVSRSNNTSGAFGTLTDVRSMNDAIKQQSAIFAGYSTNVTAAANSTARFNEYVRASNQRQQVIETKALADAKRTVTAQINNEAAAFEKSARAQVGYAAQIAAQGKQYGDALSSNVSSLSNSRYALYDVATTFAAVSAAALGAVTATSAAAISFESSFAQVERTTQVAGQAAEDLKGQLVDLSTALPVSFSDVSAIASLGGQLGIASNGITDFTDTVSKLTATTNLSAEAAGTALGRFQQLLDVPSSQFENLGSAILKVGVNSVATETQIVNTATQISSMGQYAGLSADQVIGLSGALASVGAQPELARGTITRVFTQMSTAISEGGDKLETFARIAGVSAQEFASSWGTADFAGVFQKFLGGISGEGNDAIATLKDLGISSVRDVPLLLRLSGAMGAVNGAFSDAASGFAEGTELNNQFGIVAGTVSSKLTVLKNTLVAIAAAIGNVENGPLPALIDQVQQLAAIFLSIANNPVAKAFIALGAVITAFVGVVVGLKAVAALTTASLYAMQTAQTSLAASSSTATIASRGLATQMFTLIVGVNRATAVQAAYTMSLNGSTSAFARLRAGMVAAKVAAVAFGAAAKGALISTGIGAAILAISFGVSKLVEAFSSGSDSVDEFAGSMAGLTDAIGKDTADVAAGTATAIRTISNNITQSSPKYAKWAQDLKTSAGVMLELNDNTRDTTTQITTQTLALAENSRAFIANTLANNAKFQEAWKENGAVLEAVGVTFSDLVDAVLASDTGGSDLLGGMKDSAIETRDSLTELAAEAATTGDATFRFSDAQKDLLDASKTNIKAFDSFLPLLKDLQGGIGNAITGYDLLSSTQQKNAGEADALAAAEQEQSDAIDNVTKSIFNAANAQTAMQNSTAALGQSLAENGTSFNNYSAQGRANLDALNQTIAAITTAAGGNSAKLNTMLQGLMSSLTAHGVNAVQELGFVSDAIAELTKTSGPASLSAVSVQAKMAGYALDQGLATGADKAATSTAKAAKQVRTLKDYVNDLSGVFDRILELKFGLDEAKDNVKSAWDDVKDAYETEAKKDPVKVELELNLSDDFDKKFGRGEAKDSIAQFYLDLAEAADEAARKVRDANNAMKQAQADLAGLKSDKSVLEYQLKIAQKYGDALRAQEIQAELIKNAADQAKAQADLADAQKDAKDAAAAQNKTLKGNSQAALNNRKTVRGMVGEYTDYIQALIDSGASQKDINAAIVDAKADFLSQGQALGYNTAELQKYATVFDTYGKSLDKAEATKKANEQLDSTSKKVAEQKQAVRDLITAYGDQIVALANSGLSQDQLRTKTDLLKADFEAQAKQAGLSKEEIKKYKGSFDDLKYAIEHVPKSLTVKANTNPAVEAVNEYKAALKSANTQADKLESRKFKSSYDEAKMKAYAKAAVLQGNIDAALIKMKTVKNPSAAQAISDAIKGWERQLAALQFNQGGLVPGGAFAGGAPNRKDTQAAWLQPGEFVVTEQAVRNVGLPFLNSLNNMQTPQYVAAGGGSSSVSMPSSIVVELSPTDRQLMQNSGGAVVVLDGQVLTDAVNRRNANNTTRNNN